MTFDEWYNKYGNFLYSESARNPYPQSIMKISWDAALEEAIDEIRAHITVDDQERMDKAINNLKNLIT